MAVGRIAWGAVVGFALIVAVGSAGAEAPERQTMCHWDAEAGEYVQLSLPAKAIEAHSRHEADILPGETLNEDCSPKVVLARAVSFDTSGGEHLIVQLVDNGDGVPGPGDLLEFGEWPTSTQPDPSDYVAITDDGRDVIDTHVLSADVQVPSSTQTSLRVFDPSGTEGQHASDGFKVTFLDLGPDRDEQLEMSFPTTNTDGVLTTERYEGEDVFNAGDEDTLNYPLISGSTLFPSTFNDWLEVDIADPTP